MKFLADENMHSDIVEWLRVRGHDVLYAADSLRQRPDDELLSIARNESRVLMTADKDFGELVFHRKLVTQGIILVRISLPIAERLQRLAQAWSEIEAQVPGKFIVVSEYKVRIRGL